MVTHEGARRVTRAGGLFAVIGGGIALAIWLFAYSGDPFRPSILFVWPFGAGGVISLVGLILEKYAKQSDVGRQTRQP
jgi:hypothetical protein